MIYCNNCHRKSTDSIQIGENESESFVCCHCKSDNFTELNEEENDSINSNTNKGESLFPRSTKIGEHG